MPTPTSPVVTGLEQFEVVFAKDQPEYTPLPALIGAPPTRTVISRWEFTPEERKLIADGADVFVAQMIGEGFLQPTSVFVAGRDQPARPFQEMFAIGDVIMKENVENVLDSIERAG